MLKAVYGAKDRGHRLLAHSEGEQDRMLFERLEGETDSVGYPPSVDMWPPYLRGFPYGDFYVVTKTFPDRASQRKGLVRTYALLVNEAEIAQRSLEGLISLLPRETISPDAFVRDDIAFEPEPIIAPEGATEALAAGLLATATLRAPLLWVGHDGFVGALAEVWANLPGPVRVHFRFSFAFDQHDFVGEGDHVVVVARESSSHWSPKLLRTDATAQYDKNAVKDYPATFALLTHGGGEEVRTFMEEAGIVPGRISDIEGAESLLQRLEVAKNSFDVDEVRSGARLLAAKVPDAERMSNSKRSLFEQLMSLTSQDIPRAVIALSNLSVEAFPGGQALIERSAQGWVDHLFAHRDSSLTDTARLFERLHGAHGSWAEALRGAFARTTKRFDRPMAETVWSWWAFDASMVSSTEPLLPSTPNIEDALVATCPHGIDISAGRAVRDLAYERGWSALFGTMLAQTEPLGEALTVAQAQASGPSDDRAVRALSRRVPPDEFVREAAQRAERRLVHIAAEIARDRPAVLVSGDLKKSGWRTVWAESIRHGADPLASMPDFGPDDVLDAYLDQGSDVDLLTYFADKGRTDIRSYPRLAEALRKLPRALAERFARGTASGWVRSFLAGKADSLQTGLDGVWVADVIEREGWNRSPAPSTQLVRMFEAVPTLEERHLISWIAQTAHPPAGTSALGNLALKRRWSGAAKMIARLAFEGRSEWREAAQAVSSLLGPLDRFRLMLLGGSHSPSDWWAAMLDIAKELYPTGVRDREVWQRAGGKLDRLPLNAPGGDQWIAALDSIRKGADPSIESLLEEMRRDYRQNPNLRILDESKKEARR